MKRTTITLPVLQLAAAAFFLTTATKAAPYTIDQTGAVVDRINTHVAKDKTVPEEYMITQSTGAAEAFNANTYATDKIVPERFLIDRSPRAAEGFHAKIAGRSSQDADGLKNRSAVVRRGFGIESREPRGRKKHHNQAPVVVVGNAGHGRGG
jgi:hypothetical protein